MPDADKIAELEAIIQNLRSQIAQLGSRIGHLETILQRNNITYATRTNTPPVIRR